MPCVDWKWFTLCAALAVAGCATQSGAPQGGGQTSASTPVESKASSGKAGAARLVPPSAPRNWDEARAQAARRMVAANPDQTYTGKPPDMLLAIPVLSIELNGDGSVRNIEVMRKPSQALDTIELAKQAVRRAAPFGDVSRLPKPWKFNETFLFNDQRKFKPMTLDQR
ncbi:hypothetical protein [Aquabacterium sp.]|uniref:hypothetical protein n=1 Tax=Aquabacterium sp. TaxID=1872578 RepID=UPI002E3530CC|nr:hypothetical protein [Aquabacterium sp.]HEX5312175.1 hypothetical protein [Aquabacterium sp.]